MPKVSDEYIMEKKNGILDCAMTIIAEKPLYQMTMRDLIKRLGVSQGVIYRYYTGLDEILRDLMNRETKEITVLDAMKEILELQCSSSEKLKLLFLELGKYIVRVQNKIGGKFYFEFIVHFAFDPANRDKILLKLEFKQELMKAQQLMLEFIMQKIKAGEFAPSIPINAIISYVSVTIDGISNDNALNNGNAKEYEQMPVDTQLLFGMLADTVLNYLKK